MGEFTREIWLEEKASLAEGINSNKTEIKRVKDRLSKVEDISGKIQDININIVKILETMKHHNKELEEQNERLDALEKLPSDRWNSLVTLIVGSVVGYCINFLLHH